MVTENEVFNCAGWQAINRISSLSHIHNVFFQNGLELHNLLNEIHNDAQVSQDTQEKVFYHLQQKIFNYLAASSALTDNARRFMKYYKGTIFYKEYEKKVIELFQNNKLSHFIRNLRNYQTHFELVFPYPVRSLEDDKHWDVVLISAELLKHKEEWNLEAKEFIKDCGKEVNLTQTFAEYTNIINAFYLWLYTKFSEYHKDDLIERDQLIKLAKLQSPEQKINPLNLTSDWCEEIINFLQERSNKLKPE